MSVNILSDLTAELRGKTIYRSIILEDPSEFGPGLAGPARNLVGTNIIGTAALKLSSKVKDFTEDLCTFTIRYNDSDSEPLRFEGKFVGTEIGGDSIFDIYSFLDFPRDCEESAVKMIKEPDAKAQALSALKVLNKDGSLTEDVKAAHMDADKILCAFLRGLGHGDVVEEFEKVEKWYS